MSRIKKIAVVFMLALALTVGVVGNASACGANGGSCPCPIPGQC